MDTGGGTEEPDVQAQNTLAGPEAEMCKHWRLHYGQCFFGESCLYRHPAISGAVIAEQKAEYARKREQKKQAGKRPQVRNGSKVIVFRNFLHRVFSQELLRTVPVLDIAGGKGELAFELANRDQCDVTVVDPRPLSTQRYHRKFVLGVFHDLLVKAKQQRLVPGSQRAAVVLAGDHFRMWNALLQQWLDNRGPNYVLDPSTLGPGDLDEMFNSVAVNLLGPHVTAAMPGHLQLFWTPILWEHILQLPVAVRSDPKNYPRDFSDFVRELERYRAEHEQTDMPAEELLRFAFHASLTVNWTEKGLVLDGKEERRLMDQSLLTDAELQWLTDWSAEQVEEKTAKIEWPLARVRALLETCGLVVGLHPDQATEGLVDFCLATGKPFAVVPCCIYSKQFSKRRLVDGTLVRTVDQLVQHLMEKHPAIQKETLGFQGKNTVLYWTGPAHEPPE